MLYADAGILCFTKSHLRLVKPVQIRRQVGLSVTWEITIRGIFFPDFMLSLQINSIQFTDLNISDSSRKIFFSQWQHRQICVWHVSYSVQLHSKLNTFSASASLIQQFLEKWERKIPLWRSTALVWPHRPAVFREVSWQSGIRGHRPALLKRGFSGHLMQMDLHIICA